MRYRDTAAGLSIDLKPGCQVLGGEEAEGYLRFRKDALGDIGRIQRQQAFFHALKEKLLSPAGLLRLPRVVAAVEPYVKTDLTREERGAILGFATKRPELVSLLLPGRFGGGGWEVDREALRTLLGVYFGQGAPLGEAALEGRLVALVYGPGQEALAERVREKLRSLGLRTSPSRGPASFPHRGPGERPWAPGQSFGRGPGGASPRERGSGPGGRPHLEAWRGGFL